MYGSEFYNFDNAIQYAYEVAIIELFYYGYDYILMLYSSKSRLIKRFRLAFFVSLRLLLPFMLHPIFFESDAFFAFI